MKLIQPHCRDRFEAQDIDFVVSVLGRQGQSSECLVRLLADEQTRDLLLDDEALYRALVEQGGCLRVSCRFYFYVIVRHVFRKASISDRDVADYVAEVLADFSRPERARWIGQAGEAPLEYFYEMLAALADADERTRFLLRLHMGNYALFLSGLFPDRIRWRAESKGFPDLDYYERIGQSSFQQASDHRLAHRYELASVLSRLADEFGNTRVALNDISGRLLSIGDEHSAVDALLIQTLGRSHSEN